MSADVQLLVEALTAAIAFVAAVAALIKTCIEVVQCTASKLDTKAARKSASAVSR